MNCDICSQEFRRKYKEETGQDMGSVPGYCCVEYFVNEENFYRLTCSAGHQFSIIYNEEKYELLFKAGVAAFEAGYLREAVSSVAASVERFYEYLIRVMCLSENLKEEVINDTWKLVKSQSERQIGSYIYLYLITMKSKPIMIEQKKVELRNDVIHKGAFPSEEQTLNYLKYILDYYYNTLETFEKTHAKYLCAPYKKREEDYHKTYKNSSESVMFSYSSLFIRFIPDGVIPSGPRIPLNSFITNARKSRYIRENWERNIQYYNL